MKLFTDLNLKSPLQNGLDELGFKEMTPIQEQSFPVILSGKDMVGIAQTGTGKTLGYMLPLLHDLAFAEQIDPRILVLVPTRELVVQVVENIESYAKYLNLRTLGIYGGVNINTHKREVAAGCDIIVATPGRLYDLLISNTLKLKHCKKVVIDEVDVMLDLGFRFQLTNIFDHLPQRRQNIMFSATMTDLIEEFILEYFYKPEKVSIAVSGTRLENITQMAYPVVNFYTKANLLMDLLTDEDIFEKVLVFVDNKKSADRLHEYMVENSSLKLAVIHANKTQNYRLRSLEGLNSGKVRILISTDVTARGIDVSKITHVVNVDVPRYAENYMHRIGRTGRAENAGTAITFFTEAEQDNLVAIEKLMDYEIPKKKFPEEVMISEQLTADERTVVREIFNPNKKAEVERGDAFHEKKDKNKKTNQGGSYRREVAKKYNKPKTRGDKNLNRKKR